MKIVAVAAIDENRLIGDGDRIPWHLPADMRRLASITKGHTILMGRKTYLSIPAKFRPLSERLNLICTRSEQQEIVEGVFSDRDAEVRLLGDCREFLEKVKLANSKRDIAHLSLRGQILWIWGGAEIYKIALRYCDGLDLTRVSGSYSGDTYFPPFEDAFELIESKQSEIVTEYWGAKTNSHS